MTMSSPMSGDEVLLVQAERHDLMHDDPENVWFAKEAMEERHLLIAEVKRLRNLVVAQSAQMDQFMARIQHALLELTADDE